MNEGFRALLARPAPRRLIVGLAVAWLSFGMVALAIFLATLRATASYAVAGVAVGAFSLGSGALAPARGRLIDRRGPGRRLVALAAGYAVGLLALAVLARAHAQPWALVACAAASGASAPPLVASLRASWPSLVEASLLRRAYAVTSIVGDVGLVAAPALAGLLFVAASWLPLVVCAASAVVAAAAVAHTAGRRGGDARPSASGERLLDRRFVVLVVAEIGLGAALGLVEVAVPAAASRWGHAAYSGVLLAAFALGSVLGSLRFARREWTAPPQRRYLVAASLLAAGLLLPVAATGVASLAPLLFVPGLAYGPATISLFEALDELARSRATEAFTWLTTSGAVGTAAGSAVAGWAASNLGFRAPFAAAAVVLGVAAAYGLASGTSRDAGT